MDELNIYLLRHIFSYLEINDFCNMSLVCKKFKRVLDDDYFWECKFPIDYKKYSELFKCDKIRTIYKKYYILCLINKMFKMDNNYECEIECIYIWIRLLGKKYDGYGKYKKLINMF